MDALAYPIFTFVSSLVRQDFNSIMNAATTTLASNVLILAAAFETVFLMYFGFLIAFGKATDGIKTPNINALLYHMFTFIFMIGMLREIKTILGFILSFRDMLVSGLLYGTGVPPGTFAGKISESQLDAMAVSFAALNTAQAFIKPNDLSNSLNQTPVMLSLGADVAPQIMGGIVLLLNDMLVRIGMSISPLMIYLAFHNSTRNRFKAWLERMFGLALQGAVLALTLQLAANVTEIFSAVFLSLLTANAAANLIGFKAPIINDLQISVIRAGFGFVLTTLIVWFPANAGSFCGRSLYAVTTRVNLGDRGGIVSR
jgi:TrbL/VirB6 plasmid conjugal transfer protein